MRSKGATDFLILHLADSALPTGSFAYSSGLEAVIEFGLVKDQDQLASYIFDFSLQSILFDIPFINSFSSASNDEKFLTEAASHYDASFFSSAMYDGSITCGKNWLRMVDQILGFPDVPEKIKLFLKNCKIPTHYLIVNSMSLSLCGISADDIRTLYISSIIRDQISAAIRLGIIGPMEGHSLQHHLYRQLEKHLTSVRNRTFKEARRTGFIPEFAQMLQKNVYSKLFKN